MWLFVKLCRHCEEVKDVFKCVKIKKNNVGCMPTKLDFRTIFYSLTNHKNTLNDVKYDLKMKSNIILNVYFVLLFPTG